MTVTIAELNRWLIMTVTIAELNRLLSKFKSLNDGVVLSQDQPEVIDSLVRKRNAHRDALYSALDQYVTVFDKVDVKTTNGLITIKQVVNMFASNMLVYQIPNESNLKGMNLTAFIEFVAHK